MKNAVLDRERLCECIERYFGQFTFVATIPRIVAQKEFDWRVVLLSFESDASDQVLLEVVKADTSETIIKVRLDAIFSFTALNDGTISIHSNGREDRCSHTLIETDGLVHCSFSAMITA